LKVEFFKSYDALNFGMMNRLVHSLIPHSDQTTTHSFLTSLTQSTGDYIMRKVYEFVVIVTGRSCSWSKMVEAWSLSFVYM